MSKTMSLSTMPCVSGDCLIEMGDGSYKHVKDIRVGDILQTEFGIDFVVCVEKNHCPNGVASLVRHGGGLNITIDNPIKLNNLWVTSKAINKAVEVLQCTSLYNFVMRKDPTVLINGIIVGSSVIS